MFYGFFNIIFENKKVVFNISLPNKKLNFKKKINYKIIEYG